jgi:uncharacterized membrane protein
MSLFYVLAHFWILIFPNASEGTLRGLSTFFSVASIPVVFLLGRTLTTDRRKSTAIGLIAAFLIAVNAYHIQYAQEFRSYSLTFLLTTLSTLFLIYALEDTESKHHWPIWYIIITAAAVYSHFLAVFIIAAQAVTLPILLLDKNEYLFNFRRFLYYGIGLFGLIFPIALVAYTKGVGQISWISEPTLEDVRVFFEEITGAQGRSLLALYLVVGCIGLFFGEGFGVRQEYKSVWKFTLMTSCFVLPVIIALVISKITIPIFQDRYLLYIMPYLAILAATGIVTLASSKWRNEKYRSLSVSIGIGLLVLFAVYSAKGIKTFFKYFQKEDWRSATQLLTQRCSESFYVYYAPYIVHSVSFYDRTTNVEEAHWLYDALKNNPDSDEFAVFIPDEYSQVCLVLSHTLGNPQAEIIQAAIQKKFPEETTFNFYKVEIDIYTR